MSSRKLNPKDHDHRNNHERRDEPEPKEQRKDPKGQSQAVPNTTKVSFADNGIKNMPPGLPNHPMGKPGLPDGGEQMYQNMPWPNPMQFYQMQGNNMYPGRPPIMGMPMPEEERKRPSGKGTPQQFMPQGMPPGPLPRGGNLANSNMQSAQNNQQSLGSDSVSNDRRPPQVGYREVPQQMMGQSGQNNRMMQQLA